MTRRPLPQSARRTRPLVSFTLSPETIARLEQIAAARGKSKSAVVEQLIRRASLDATT